MDFEDVKMRADAIDAAVRLAMICKLQEGEEYQRDADTTFDRFDIRSAVALGISLYADKNQELIEAIGRVTRR